jgi:large subunit ribosomal protein L7/L12
MEVAMSKVEEVLKMVEEMTVLELSELVKACEDKFGVKAAAPVMGVAPAAAAGAAAAEEKEEKASFTVVLTASGANKIAVIKEIRAITELGLKEAKELVDGAPKTVKENVPKEEAEEIKKKLGAVGATVELK